MANTIVVVPSQQNIQQVVKTFLASILPPTIEFIQGQVNRVPEPQSTEFVVTTVIDRRRLSTNIDNFIDCAFMASITGVTMTVTEMLEVNLGYYAPPGLGTIGIGNQLLGVGIAQTPSLTTIASQNSGTPGGIGIYTLSQAQDIPPTSTKFATGIGNYIQATEVTLQLDVHSADLKLASDMAQVITTMWRDAYATTLFANSGFDITPLYADEARQIAFINEEQQYEARYVVEAHLQANQTVTLSQDFFDQAPFVSIQVPVDSLS